MSVEQSQNERGGMGLAILACCAIGALTIGVTLMAGGRLGLIRTVAAKAPAQSTEDYGRRLIAQSSELMGPDVPNPEHRYTRARLACASCHLGTGTEPGTLTLLEVTIHYPRFSGRQGMQNEIEDRINECMQRSMNGRALPKDNPEMIAMASYLRSLGAEMAAMGATARKQHEPPAFKNPDRASSPEAGKKVYQDHCAVCHGQDGLGLLATSNPLHGYVFPPLWGPDSFNDGAGMHRVLTAGKFIKARMPLGKPDLTDDETYDVAAYINDQPRPQMANLERDYPDRTTKPVDNGYGPFADSFPLRQHQIGPFGPIDAYYKSLKSKKK
jgi:thiosulfate dehydrogenase